MKNETRDMCYFSPPMVAEIKKRAAPIGITWQAWARAAVKLRLAGTEGPADSSAHKVASPEPPPPAAVGEEPF